jgi:hypothetical protein
MDASDGKGLEAGVCSRDIACTYHGYPNGSKFANIDAGNFIIMKFCCARIVKLFEMKLSFHVYCTVPEEKSPLGDQGVDGRILLRLIFGKWDVRLWTELSWLRIETGGRHL